MPTTGSRPWRPQGTNIAKPFRIAIAGTGDAPATDLNTQGPAGRPRGAVVRVNQTDGLQTVVSVGEAFRSPSGIALAANGDLLVADRTCCGNATGGVIRVNANGAQTIVSQENNFLVPAGIAIVPEPSPLGLVAAVLPSSRSVIVGTPATAFATIINAGPQPATNCLLMPSTSVPASFAFQATDPATNRGVGELNIPVAIPPGGAATFVF